jgi:hypothetical protein
MTNQWLQGNAIWWWRGSAITCWSRVSKFVICYFGRLALKFAPHLVQLSVGLRIYLAYRIICMQWIISLGLLVGHNVGKGFELGFMFGLASYQTQLLVHWVMYISLVMVLWTLLLYGDEMHFTECTWLSVGFFTSSCCRFLLALISAQLALAQGSPGRSVVKVRYSSDYLLSPWYGKRAFFYYRV